MQVSVTEESQVCYYSLKTSQSSEPVLVLSSSVEGLSKIDTVIFDLDGVIIDPRDSIERSHPITLKYWGENFRGLTDCDDLIDSADIGAFKLAGGFNDDWNIAAACGLFYSVKAEMTGLVSGRMLKKPPVTLREAAEGSARYGGAVEGFARWMKDKSGSAYESGADKCDCDLVMRIFMEMISGPECQEMYGFKAEYYTGDGLIAGDRLLIDKNLLNIPWKTGIYTGRTLGEAHVGMRITGLKGWIPDDRTIAVDAGMPKPDGRPLDILAKRLETKCGAFIGDNPDDFRSVLMYRERENGPPFYGVSVCFGGNREEARDVFLQMRSDMIAPDTASALEALASIQEGNAQWAD